MSAPTFYIQQIHSTNLHSSLLTMRRQPSCIVLYMGVLCWSLCHSCLRRQAHWLIQRGRGGWFGRASPLGGGRRINKKDPKLQKFMGAINCRGSVGSQCQLCRWGIFCWWPATDPHMPGGRGACRVISCRHKRRGADFKRNAEETCSLPQKTK